MKHSRKRAGDRRWRSRSPSFMPISAGSTNKADPVAAAAGYCWFKARPPASGQWIASLNPYTGEAWAEIPDGNAADVDAAVQAAHAAFSSGAWPQLSATERGALLRKLAALIERDADKLARTEVMDKL